MFVKFLAVLWRLKRAPECENCPDNNNSIIYIILTTYIIKQNHFEVLFILGNIRKLIDKKLFV